MEDMNFSIEAMEKARMKSFMNNMGEAIFTSGTRGFGELSLETVTHMLQRKGYGLRKLLNTEKKFAALEDICELHYDKRLFIYAWNTAPDAEAEAHFVGCRGDGTVTSCMRIPYDKLDKKQYVCEKVLTVRNLRALCYEQMGWYVYIVVEQRKKAT
jgi:hypothetical protein